MISYPEIACAYSRELRDFYLVCLKCRGTVKATMLHDALVQVGQGLGVAVTYTIGSGTLRVVNEQLLCWECSGKVKVAPQPSLIEQLRTGLAQLAAVQKLVKAQAELEPASSKARVELLNLSEQLTEAAKYGEAWKGAK